MATRRHWKLVNNHVGENIAYMIYLEGPECSEYVMHIFYLKYSWTPNYGNMLGNSLPVSPAQEATENYLKYSGCPQQRNMLRIFLHIVCPGILHVIISNGRLHIINIRLALRTHVPMLCYAMRCRDVLGSSPCPHGTPPDDITTCSFMRVTSQEYFI